MLKTLMAIAVSGAFALPLTSAASDTGASAKQEDANLPGQASPGAPRSSASGIDRDTTRERFEALDKNHDGFISRDEAKDATELDTRFSELDVNNDGKLSRDEYNAVSRGATGGTAESAATSKAKAKAGAPDKGPGAQEPANRALGSAGSGVPEGGGTSTSK